MKKKLYICSIVLLPVVLLVTTVAIVCKFWIIPAAIEQGIIKQIDKSYKGTAHVDGLKFGFNGTVRIDGIIIENDKGSKIVSINNVNAMLPDLWMLDIKVKQLRISTIEIDAIPQPKQIPASSGNFTIADQFAWLDRGYFGIENLTVDNILIGRSDTTEQNIQHANLSLDINRQSDVYKIDIENASASQAETVSIEGNINTKAKSSDFAILFDSFVSKEQVALILTLTKAGSNFTSEGHLSANVILHQDGQGDDCIFDGQINFDAWKVMHNGNPLFENLSASASIEKNDVTIDDLKADICSGKFEGAIVRSNPQDSQRALYTGRITANNIDISQLARSIDLPLKLSRGTCSLEYAFNGNFGSFEELQSQGTIFIDDGDLYQLPVISMILNAIDPGLLNIQKATDAIIVYEQKGSEVNIEKCKIGNNFWALRVVPGGIIDLKEKSIDMHVLVVPLSQIEDLLKNIPVVDLVVNLKNRLIQLKVKGKLSDSPSHLITKEPLTDIKDATIGFIRDIFENDGQVTEKNSTAK